MEFTGRVTGDAIIKTLPDERQVVNFSIAINDYYKPKDAAEGKEIRCMCRVVIGKIQVLRQSL